MTADEVFEARKRLGMTQVEFAKALRIPGDYAGSVVSSWESGRRKVGGPTSLAIDLLLERAGK